jgi:hypothetical protein
LQTLHALNRTLAAKQGANVPSGVIEEHPH